MASTKPLPPLKDSNRIGADVYIRDPEDASIQYKARTFGINYETQEADLGLFPRRWGTFSQLHLPSEYRITVPLTELSLTPYAGAEQRGFEDMLILRGEKPPVWVDNAGHVHPPGCDEPAAVSPATVVDAGGVPEPEFGSELGDAVAAVVAVMAKDPAVQELIKPVPGNTAIGMGALKESVVVGKSAATNKKPPLFAGPEILAQFDLVTAEYAKLRKMLEAVL